MSEKLTMTLIVAIVGIVAIAGIVVMLRPTAQSAAPALSEGASVDEGGNLVGQAYYSRGFGGFRLPRSISQVSIPSAITPIDKKCAGFVVYDGRGQNLDLIDSGVFKITTQLLSDSDAVVSISGVYNINKTMAKGETIRLRQQAYAGGSTDTLQLDWIQYQAYAGGTKRAKFSLCRTITR